MRVQLSVLVSSLAMVIALAGCSQGEEQRQQGAATAAATASANTVAPTAQATAAANAGAARSVAESSDLYEFDYAYPAAAGAIAGLRTWLDSDLARERSELASEARTGRDEAKAGGFPYRPFARGREWKVVTDLPGWLSLSAAVYSDGGGAHPNHGSDALLWDKSAAVQRKATDLFTSKAALAKALSPSFCDLLDRERAKRRGTPVQRDSGDQFDECIDPAAQSVILGSSDRQHFNRIGILVDPYEAGPYVEGDYEITLPVTEAVLAVVKPEFRAAFAVKR